MSAKITTGVRRYDRGTVSKAIRTDEGFVRAPARLTRTGVFEYRRPDGSIVRELRPPEEVFNADSLASFELLPLVLNHPRENGGAVNSKNAKRLSVGSIGGVRQDAATPHFVSATVLVTDSDTVDRVERGERELSCGYVCDHVEADPGSVYEDPITGKLTPYDFIQRNIRGNHVAIVPVGRAGPDAKIYLDHNDAIEVTPGDNAETKGITMIKITIDGVEFEASESLKSAIEKHTSETVKSISTLAARADSAEASVKDLTKQLATASDKASFQAAVTARVSLEKAATDRGVKCDGLDDMGVRKAVILKVSPDMKLDGKSDDYVSALFDLSLEKNPITAQFNEAAKTNGTKEVTADGEHRSAYMKGFYSVDPTKRSDSK